MTRRATPSGFGTIEPLPSGRFRAYYRHAGRKIVAPSLFPSREAAAVWLSTERLAHQNGTWIDPHLEEWTVAEYAAEWLRTKDIAPRTRETYDAMIRLWIVPRLGDVPLRKLTAVRVRSWNRDVVDAARERAGQGGRTRVHPARMWARAHGIEVPRTGRLPRSIVVAWEAAGAPEFRTAPTRDGSAIAASAYRVLHAMLNTATEDRLIPENPARVRGAGSVTAPRRSPATLPQVGALAAGMPEHLRMLVPVTAWGALRRGEVLALARQHVDLAGGFLRIERAVVELRDGALYTGPTKTVGSTRLVYLPANLMAQLAETVNGMAPDDLLFPGKSGGLMHSSELHGHWVKARKRAGMPKFRFHDLRHTGAALAYAVGASVPEVQERLGHTTQRAAAIYAHTMPGSNAALAARLNTMMQGAA